jgi:DNA polymerase-1
MTFNLKQCQIEIVDSTDRAYEFLRWIGNVQTPVMGVDVETSGLDWFDGQLRLVQFGSKSEGWAVPFEMFPQLVNEAMKILDDRRMPLVGHNFKFDLHWLERHTTWTPKNWGIYHDTLLMASVLDSSGSKGLKDLAARYVSDIAKDGQSALQEAFKKGGWTWGTVPVMLEAYWVYGVIDTILTVNLMEVLLQMVHDAGCMEAYEVERGCVPALFAMERRGILIDSDYCRDHITKLHGRMAEIDSEVFEFGVANINAGDQLVRAFLDAGVELTAKTPSGKYSMSKDALEELVSREGNHPLVALVGEHRSAQKFASSYYENFLAYQRSDGRVHPAYRQAQARTGRMSAQFPAIQTLPRPETDRDVRNSFVADEGNVFISTDFANVEARIFAHFAQEDGMLEAIRSGVDLHGYTAQQVYHQWDTVAPKDHPLRQVAKNTLFCMLFGGGPGKVATTAGVDIETAKESFDGIHRAFPGIKVFQKRVEAAALQNLAETGRAWIRGVDGRILMMSENDDRYYAFTNWLIQGTATVLLKQRLAVIHNMGLSESCVATIHDEVVGEIPEEDAEEFAVLMAEAMLDEHQFSVPVVAEPGTPARRLGDAK